MTQIPSLRLLKKKVKTKIWDLFSLRRKTFATADARGTRRPARLIFIADYYGAAEPREARASRESTTRRLYDEISQPAHRGEPES
jgi:hypothetical protein